MCFHRANVSARQNRRSSGDTPGLALAVLVALMFSACGVSEQKAQSIETNGSAAINDSVTTGAAPGYINDQACAACHIEVYNSYQQMGMAKSFFRPTADKVIEDFDKSFYHPASQRHYQMTFRDGTYLFRRCQLDTNQQPINELELKVDWVLGSGHNGRTYVYREPNGEMYQLALGGSANRSARMHVLPQRLSRRRRGDGPVRSSSPLS